MLQPPPHFQRVGQIAVVPQRDFALVAVDHHRLRVDDGVVARRGIARVADRHRARQARKHRRRENFLHVPEALVEVHAPRRRSKRCPPIPARDAAGVKAEIGQLGRFGMAENAEYAAVIVEMIVVERVNFWNHALSSASASDPLQTCGRNPQFLRSPCPLYIGCEIRRA